MTSYPRQPNCPWFSTLAKALDPRSAARLACLFVGVILARGRKTISQWIRAAQLSQAFRCCYTTVAAAGKRSQLIATYLLVELIKPLLANTARIVVTIDDTPTPRYGPHVQGAGIHHNPTPGPAGSPFVYGHVWVVLALLIPHPLWGIIALPLLARLYIRKKDLAGIDPKHRPAFATKLEMAVELVKWAAGWLKYGGKPVWLVVDGAYAKAPVLKEMLKLGVTVVSRLRKDAALRTVPGPRLPGQRGRTRKYGVERIELAKRAGQKRGWTISTFELYGKSVQKKYKTFAATWQPAGGVIRVVLLDEPTGWVAFFCTDVNASVGDILGLVADRFCLETAFRDVKEVVGAGQQQVRFVWASVGSFHLCLWSFTLSELWAWHRPASALVAHRSASPWDDDDRRPSHADKRRAWRRELLENEITAVMGAGQTDAKIRDLTDRLLNLAA
ncbi:MAG: transposase [Actinobacteria bacterium]|nr:transposase [Actinomycetota bacterium]